MKTDNKYTYVLRTCTALMRSYGDFQWLEHGPVKAKDWKPTPECGNGLHGFAKGEGNAALVNPALDAKWLVVRVRTHEIVDLKGKVKFPRGFVMYAGDRETAVRKIQKRYPAASVMFGTATAGYRGTATAGYKGTATAGYRGILQIRHWDGSRSRITTAYVGEAGILPDTKYELDSRGQFVPWKKFSGAK